MRLFTAMSLVLSLSLTGCVSVSIEPSSLENISKQLKNLKAHVDVPNVASVAYHDVVVNKQTYVEIKITTTDQKVYIGRMPAGTLSHQELAYLPKLKAVTLLGVIAQDDKHATFANMQNPKY